MIFNKRKVSPIYEVGSVTNCQNISKLADAVLVIGDTALTQPWGQVLKYRIDLGHLWYEMTQLPFVFAVWAVRRSFAGKYPSIVNEIHKLLLASKKQVYQHIDKVIEVGKNKLNLEQSVIKEYFDLLYCDLDDQKINAMQLFFDSLLDQKIINKRANIHFFIL